MVALTTETWSRKNASTALKPGQPNLKKALSLRFKAEAVLSAKGVSNDNTPSVVPVHRALFLYMCAIISQMDSAEDKTHLMKFMTTQVDNYCKDIANATSYGVSRKEAMKLAKTFDGPRELRITNQKTLLDFLSAQGVSKGTTAKILERVKPGGRLNAAHLREFVLSIYDYEWTFQYLRESP
jgi:hypothetical protein